METQRNREDAGGDAVTGTEAAPPTKAALSRKRRGDTVEAKGKAKEQMENSSSRQDEKMDPQQGASKRSTMKFRISKE